MKPVNIICINHVPIHVLAKSQVSKLPVASDAEQVNLSLTGRKTRKQVFS